MSCLLLHFHSGWTVNQSILAEEDHLDLIRFGNDLDETCAQMDEVLASVAETIKNFAVIYIQRCPISTQYTSCTILRPSCFSSETNTL